MTINQKRILITSTGRTATKFLANYFSEDVEKICSFHISDYSTLFNVLGNFHLNFGIKPTLLLRLWNYLKKEDFIKCEKEIFLDSNNLLYAIPLLLEKENIYSGIVHIIRDPRDYVRSHYNWAKNRKKSWVADRLIPFWQPNGWMLDNISLVSWLKMNRFQRFCWIWTFKNKFISKINNNENTNYILIRFEDLFSCENNARHFDLLNKFVGKNSIDSVSTTTNNRTNATKIKTFSHWRSWSPKKCAQLDALCGEMMSKHGYGLEDDWKTMVMEGNKIL